ncbi:MAG: efflux transporter outer membrane subunit [Opitutaceae bacterium]|jgi:NodT family efflux transporter outer membrane factor (OMF) lipoprotein
MKAFLSSARQGAGLGLVLAVLGACAVGPNFVRPTAPDASRYTHEPLPAATVPADGQAQQFTPDATLSADWWRLFKSEPLDAAVRQSIANNPTLQAAEATLRQSQDNLRAGYGVFYPRIDAQAGASRQRTAPLQQGLTTSSSIFNLVTLSGTVSYALDVFGGERRTVEGLRAQAEYQSYANMAAYLTLSANVANAAIARAAYAAEIRATEQLIDLERQQLQLTEVQVRSGTTPYSSVLSMRSLIAANQALLAPLRQRVSQSEDLLATLEGVVPSKATLPEIELTALAVPVDLPVSLPSDLVRQRPDILSAEAQLHVASATIGVATAAMFPSISLSGTYGASGTSFGTLSAARGRFWSIGPSATVPLFQGGTLWYGRKAAIDAFQQSQAAYRETVLSAFAQVADSLKALEHDAEALQAQVDARLAASEALVLLRANYHAGLVAYPDVLAADVQLHQATIAYLQAVAQRHQDTVALFAALGGGWWNAKSTAGEGGMP